MKKLVGVVLALVLVLTAVSAMAQIVSQEMMDMVASTVADHAQFPAKIELPTMSYSVDQDGHMVVYSSIQSQNEDAYSHFGLSITSDDEENYWVSCNYDAERGAYVSNSVVTGWYDATCKLNYAYGYSNYYDEETKSYKGQDAEFDDSGVTWYAMINSDSDFERSAYYNVTKGTVQEVDVSNGDERIEVMFKTNGEYNGVYMNAFTGNSDIRASFDRYGNLNYSEMYDYNTGSRYLWDESVDAWINDEGETLETEIVPGTSPYVVPYVPYVAGTELSELSIPATNANLNMKATVQTTENQMIIKVSDVVGKIQNVEIFCETEDGNTWISADYDRESDAYVIDIPENCVEILNCDVNLNNGYVRVDTNGTVESAISWLDDMSVNYSADGLVTVNYYDSAAAFLLFDKDGKLESYHYLTAKGENVQLSVSGDLLYYAGEINGVTYRYNEEKGWTKFDEETGKYVECDEPAGLDLEALKLLKPKKAAEPEIWYPHNTVSIAGLSLRDEYPGLTDKWYNVVPVDLTQDGVYQYRLVASNLFYIGSAVAVVKDGTVTVDYSMAKGLIYPEDECLQWFTSVDQITGDFLNAPVGAYSYGEPVSIADDLGGAEVGLLFICNKVTYRQPYTVGGAKLVRYWKNLDEWKAYRQDLYGLMDKLAK